MKLTQPQIQAYRENGYHLFGPLLNQAQADRMAGVYLDCLSNYQSDHASRRVSNVRDGKGGGQLWKLRCAHLMDPGFDAIMRDPRLLDAVESLIGPNIRVVVCQGFYKPAHRGDPVNWHQDNHYFRVDKPDGVVSCWLALDDVTIDNGCMWVVPGGHRSIAKHDVDANDGSSYMPDVPESQAVPVELKRGQCMLHHGLMPHRTLANKTSSPRRALAIHYMDATATLPEARSREPAQNTPVVRGSGRSEHQASCHGCCNGQ